MTDRETNRLIAWGREMTRVHARLREALVVSRDAVRAGEEMPGTARDLLLYCHGFCVALDGHHRGEDATLFPAVERAHPELAPVLRALEGDHAKIGHLLGQLEAALHRSAPPAELDLHLEGVGALMENHFRYEERRLLTVLEGLDLPGTIDDVLGPL